MNNTYPIALFWFRRDLRLHDNVALHAALKIGNPVLPLFIFDTDILDQLPSKEDKRVAFIHKAIEQLQSKLQRAGSSLLVMHGKPESVFKILAERYTITAVFANADYEPKAMERDQQVAQLLQQKNIPLKLFKDQVVFEKDEVLKSDGTPFKVFTLYSKAWKNKLASEGIDLHPSETLLHNLLQTQPLPIPTLAEIGFEPIATPSPVPIIDESILRNYDQTRNFPGIQGTSNLSIHLRFGTVSIRELVRKAQGLNETFLDELIWREFFSQILYHFPHVVTKSFKEKYEQIAWRNDENEFQRWCKGETGYPIVDAGMRELNETGHMHNRVRMIVASFLVKHLLIDWRWGEAYFAEKLLDYELASNNGNWQWSAGCGCDAVPYFRVFNPYEQQAKFDPDWSYTKKWVHNVNQKDYPTPVVDHKFARERFLQVFKTALER